MVATGLLLGAPSRAAPPSPKNQRRDALLTAGMVVLQDYCASEGRPSVTITTYAYDYEEKSWPSRPRVLGACTPTPIDLAQAAFFAASFVEQGVQFKDLDDTFDLWELKQDVSEASEAFRVLFGRALVSRTLTLANNEKVVQYAPKAIDALFHALYLKPTDTWMGTSTQAIYNALFRTWVADTSRELAKVLERKRAFVDLARQFADRAMKDEAFWGIGAATEAASKIDGRNADADPLVDARFMGTLLRRHWDGTLPVIVSALRTILRDYDSGAFRELDKRLRW